MSIVTKLVTRMKARGYCLRLVSTVKGSPAEFSASFYKSEPFKMDHIRPRETTWDEVSHGDTIEDAVMAAYLAAQSQESVNNVLGD